MLRLYRTSKRKTDRIREIPFKDERGDLQSFVAENPELLGGRIEILVEKMPIMGGEIDILAIDNTGTAPRLVIVELKMEARRELIGQVLDYAERISLDPEKIRQKAPSLTDNEIQNPKLVIVAPTISDRLVSLTRRVRMFEWDIIELRRFADKRGVFAVTNRRLLPEEEPEEPNWDIYRIVFGYNEANILRGKKLLRYLQALCVRSGWDLQLRQEVAYRPAFGEWSFDRRGTGGRIEDAFGIGPGGKEDLGWHLWFRLPRKPTDYNAPLGDDGTEWMTDGNYFFIYLTGVHRGLHKIVEDNSHLFRQAYQYANKRGGNPN